VIGAVVRLLAAPRVQLFDAIAGNGWPHKCDDRTLRCTGIIGSCQSAARTCEIAERVSSVKSSIEHLAFTFCLYPPFHIISAMQAFHYRALTNTRDVSGPNISVLVLVLRFSLGLDLGLAF